MVKDFLGFIQLEIIGIFDFLAPISHDMCVHTHAESIYYILFLFGKNVKIAITEAKLLFII